MLREVEAWNLFSPLKPKPIESLMKLIIQIPCFNEAESLPVTLFALVLGTMGRNNSDALAAVAVLAGLLLYLGVIVAALVIGVKLIYTLPFLGVEGRGPVAAIKASWSLTTGRFWRTLGYLLVAMLLLYVANVVVSLVSYVVILVTTGVGGLAGRASTDSTAQTLALLAGMVPGLIVTVLLSVAVSLITVPFMAIYSTLMYRDQQVRDRTPASAGRSVPGPGASPFRQPTYAPGPTGPWSPPKRPAV